MLRWTELGADRLMKEGASARAVFLDRDGTLIDEKEYLSDPAGIVLIPGAVEALVRLRQAGLTLVVVTNQSGIGRGLYTEEDYRRVEAALDGVLERAGAPVDATFFCPDHPDFTGPTDCRKPAAGMYHAAKARLDLDLARSYYVGDKQSDVLPALELGGMGILVRTGYGREHESGLPAGMSVADDLLEASRLILEHESRASRNLDGS